MFGLGIGELSIVLVIVIVVFGATRLPMIGAGLGKGIKNFRSEITTSKAKEKKEKIKEVEKKIKKS